MLSFNLSFIYFCVAQPPGIPEILKKSLASCSSEGGEELIIIGKNFTKDAKVLFRANPTFHADSAASNDFWEEQVVPQKEFLHQVRSPHLFLIKN